MGWGWCHFILRNSQFVPFLVAFVDLSPLVEIFLVRQNGDDTGRRIDFSRMAGFSPSGGNLGHSDHGLLSLGGGSNELSSLFPYPRLQIFNRECQSTHVL